MSNRNIEKHPTGTCSPEIRLLQREETKDFLLASGPLGAPVAFSKQPSQINQGGILRFFGQKEG